jgi:CheY-like chemotaxis protein
VRTVLVVDDDEQVREMLSRHFAGNPHIAAVFEAANAAAALAGTEEHRPTAIVLDLALRVLRVGGQ